MNELKQTIKSLMAEYSHLEIIFDSLHVGIVVTDKEFVVIRANDPFCSMMNKRAQDVYGRLVFDLPQFAGVPHDVMDWNKPFGEHEPYLGVVKVWLKGKNRVYTINGFPIQNITYNTKGMVFVLTDVTEQQIEEQQKKMAVVGRMTAGIAHEMNNPLSGISGFADLMLRKRKKYGLTEDGVRVVQSILEKANRAAGVLGDLLDFSANKRNLTMEPVSIHHVAQVVIDRLSVEKKMEIETQFMATEDVVKGNTTRLERLVHNILRNSISAVQEKLAEGVGQYKPQVMVCTRNEDQSIVLSIEDNGVGISMQNLKQIFDPFFSTYETEGRAGMGLSICYNIVKEHGGKIEASCRDSHTFMMVVLPIKKK